MDGSEASRLHASLAHSLLPVWIVCTRVHEVLHTELSLWQQRAIANEDEFFQQILTRFRMMNVEPDAVDALNRIESGYERLNEIFQKLSQRVRARYEATADWDEAGDPELVKAWVANPPYPDEAPFGMLGVAACVPPRRLNGHAAQVKLTFAPSLLGPPSWAAMPYLLCHELVCHVSQRAPTDSGDPFAEGWMDLVAHRMHDRWVRSVFPWAPEFAHDSAEELSRITRRRGNGIPHPHDKTRAARQVGRSAAGRMEELLRLAGSVRPAAALERLSLQLNRVDATVADRLAFVGLINSCAGTGPEQLGKRYRLRELLGQWLVGEVDARKVLFFT